MHYSLTFLEEHHKDLTAHLLRQRPAEGAAFLICGLSESAHETKLLVREVIPVGPDDALESSPTHMKIAPRSFLRAMKRANSTETCFVFVHSHPQWMPGHSQRDYEEERALFRTAYNRIHCGAVHASIVYSDVEKPAGRVWLESGQTEPIRVIRVVGDRLRLFYPPGADNDTITDLARCDRQVRAFGPEMQTLLSRMNVGVVGAGGTGSCVIEQLIRLGVGSLTIADGQSFEGSNVTRVYGSRATDDGTAKTRLMERLGSDIGTGTRIIPIAKPITFQSVLKQFRDCEVIFGCTDDQWGRSLLTRLSIYYYIPVFDMGVKIDSDCGKVRSLQGRVTTLMPGTACLFCRRRISSEVIAAETRDAMDPSGAAELRREGYAPELRDVAPAVITFTTAVAATAVSELLHRLTGFMGTERRLSEVIHLFDMGSVRANNTAAGPDCFCTDRENWGRGDIGQTSLAFTGGPSEWCESVTELLVAGFSKAKKDLPDLLCYLDGPSAQATGFDPVRGGELRSSKVGRVRVSLPLRKTDRRKPHAPCQSLLEAHQTRRRREHPAFYLAAARTLREPLLYHGQSN